MSIIRVSAKLDRTDSQTPWGFRMAGGKDYNSPLVIQKINPGSLSSKCGIKESDVITHIGGFGVAHLTHREAQDLIIGSGNNLELKLERCSGVSHNNSDGSDGYFQQQPRSLPWQPPQQQPHRPGPGLYNFAPKPFQRNADVTTITSHVANLNVRNAPHPIQEPADNLIDMNGDDKEKLPMPLDGESPPLSYCSTNEMQDDTPPGKFLPKIEQTNAGIPLADNLPADLKNTKLTKPIGCDRSDGTNEREDVKSHGSQLENADQSKDPLESRRIFSRRTSDLQPQSKSFMRLRGLLDGENSKDCEDDKASIVRQTSINDKPQISAKPKLVPPPRPKPFASSNRSDSPAKDPGQSNLSEDNLNLSGPSPQIKPDSNKPLPQPDSPPIKIVPPTRPKPAFKQYNSPIGLYSKQAQTEAEPSKNSDSSHPHPQLPIKEASSGDDVVIAVPSQRKTITIQNNKNRVESPSSHAAAPDAVDVVVQSFERKQIIVKSKSVNTSSTPPTFNSNSSEIDLNGNKTVSISCEPTGPRDVIYGSEKAKIILKKRETTDEKPIMDFTLEDLGLSDAVVVGISLPDHMRECMPSSAAEVTESRSQIKVVPRAAHSTQHRIGSPPQHHLPGPRSPPTSGGIVWRPHIPVGERKMKIGRPGQAQRRPPMSGSARIPICATCHTSIRGPYVTALDKTWCPDHFVCANPNCSQPLFDCGFVEEADQLYCEKDYERYLAPRCARCSGAIVGEVVNAMKNTYHVQCFVCAACHQPIGTGSFHNEDGKIYCAKDWGLMFQTKCYGCQFPIETGDRWVEALSQNWHSECFNCYTCQINLEGQSFCAKNGKPYCKKHGATRGF